MHDRARPLGEYKRSLEELICSVLCICMRARAGRQLARRQVGLLPSRAALVAAGLCMAMSGRDPEVKTQPAVGLHLTVWVYTLHWAAVVSWVQECVI